MAPEKHLAEGSTAFGVGNGGNLAATETDGPEIADRPAGSLIGEEDIVQCIGGIAVLRDPEQPAVRRMEDRTEIADRPPLVGVDEEQAVDADDDSAVA